MHLLLVRLAEEDSRESSLLDGDLLRDRLWLSTSSSLLIMLLLPLPLLYPACLFRTLDRNNLPDDGGADSTATTEEV